jgi:uncharacterized short protein YbdD (DUF466 family)
MDEWLKKNNNVIKLQVYNEFLAKQKEKHKDNPITKDELDKYLLAKKIKIPLDKTAAMDEWLKKNNNVITIKVYNEFLAKQKEKHKDNPITKDELDKYLSAKKIKIPLDKEGAMKIWFDKNKAKLTFQVYDDFIKKQGKHKDTAITKTELDAFINKNGATVPVEAAKPSAATPASPGSSAMITVKELPGTKANASKVIKFRSAAIPNVFQKANINVVFNKYYDKQDLLEKATIKKNEIKNWQLPSCFFNEGDSKNIKLKYNDPFGKEDGTFVPIYNGGGRKKKSIEKILDYIMKGGQTDTETESKLSKELSEAKQKAETSTEQISETEKEENNKKLADIKQKKEETIVQATIDLEEKTRIEREKKIDDYNKLKEELEKTKEIYRILDNSSSDNENISIKDSINKRNAEIRKEINYNYDINEKNRLFNKEKDEENKRKEKIIKKLYEENKKNILLNMQKNHKSFIHIDEIPTGEMNNFLGDVVYFKDDQIATKFRNNYNINVFSNKFYSKNDLVKIMKKRLNIDVNTKEFEPSFVEEKNNGKILYYGGNINSILNELLKSDQMPENTTEEIDLKIKQIKIETEEKGKNILTNSEKKTTEEIEKQKALEIKQKEENKKIRAENKKLLEEAKKSNIKKHIADAEEIYRIKKALNKKK